MKKLSLIAMLLSTQLLFAQKEYSHWIGGIGYCWPPYPTTYGNVEILFNENSATIYSNCRDSTVFYDTNASICDTEGNLLFYTNGSHIYTRDDAIMPNGDSINYGYIWEDWGLGYPAPMGAMILSLPDNDSLYYVFTMLIEPVLMPGYNEPGTKLSYSIVNRYLNNGLGVVTHKEIPIIQDTLNSAMITACRHANGRDWWIAVPECATNCIYTCLFTPTGISNVQKQCLGHSFNMLDWNGQVCFSPDGEWYARHTPYDDLHLYRFDRCTGQFYSPIDIYVNGANDYALAAGVAFSPNSRYLYITKTDALYQYDTEANDIAASKIVVDTSDYFQDSEGMIFNFYSMRLAPDKKIYMSSANSPMLYGLISSPDEGGQACNFQEHLPLPHAFAFGLPNFPYNGLKAELGSACDTLGVAWGEVSVSGLQFGGVHLGDSLSLTAKLRSTGTGTLHLAPDIGVGSSFSISPPSIYIGAGDSLEVAVKFKPAAVGAYSELLPLLSNIPGGIALQLPVTGVGLLPDAIASPDPSKGGETRQIRLFPNPLRDWMFLEGEFASFELYDVMGRKVLESQEKKVLLAELPKGLYLVRVRDGEGRVLKMEKVVKI